MPTRKQRRRIEKQRRHEYEWVVEDDEGNEIPLEEVDDPEFVSPPRAKQRERRERSASKAPAKGQAKGRSGRAARPVPPPSWRRVAKRGAIFVPLMLVFVYALRPKGASVASVLLQGVILVLFFLPFSYFMDSYMHRSYLRRTGQSLPPKSQRDARARRDDGGEKPGGGEGLLSRLGRLGRP